MIVTQFVEKNLIPDRYPEISLVFPQIESVKLMHLMNNLDIYHSRIISFIEILTKLYKLCVVSSWHSI